MSDVLIHGHVDPAFDRVRQAFEANFAEGREVGASFAVQIDGRMVVDLWGGFTDAARTRVWQKDTLANVWSTTKGFAALCIAMLVDRRELSYDQTVASIWPAFAAAGKENLTVAEVLSHQGGLSGVTTKIRASDYADREKILSMLAAQEPLFATGQSGYHAMMYGFLAGEIVRRVSGRSLGRFFAEEVAGPLGADAWIGLPEKDDARAAEMVPAAGPPTTSDGAPVALPPHPAARAALANPPLDARTPNERWWREIELPAANAQANARSIATVYGMLARSGQADGHRYLSLETIREATRTRVHSTDLVLGIPMRWAAGFARNDGAIYGPNRETFGHSGWGGSFGCADLDAHLAMGYAMNQMFANLRGDPRSLALISAVYASLA
ncbi:MAG TPA: serine hydrolase domain-containing protein [Candidatus Binatia bacterium]|jgi:CubicO group peptidase (beta-lactamase class C family)